MSADDHPPAGRRSLIEQHIQTILIAVITGALFFAANYMFSDNEARGVQQGQLRVLTDQIIEMRGELRSLQNNYVRREEFKELETRLRSVELQQRTR